MEILKTLFSKKSLSPKYTKKSLDEIRKILADYFRKQISIVECVSNTGPLTAELIYKYSADNTTKSVYDTILVIITNYYVMLYMEMYTGFYAVSRNHTCNMVSSLVEEVLLEMAKKQKGLKTNDPHTAIHKSRHFTRQMVEVYYRTGIDDCHRYVATSIYWALLTENRNLSVKREWVEQIVRATQAEKFLAGNSEETEFIN